MPRPTLIERAFELARMGATMSQIRAQLRRDGYELVNEQLTGRVIARQLRAAGAAPNPRPHTRMPAPRRKQPIGAAQVIAESNTSDQDG